MAAEFASSAAANAVGNVATEYASPYVSYFFRYGKIVEEFKKNRRQLELKKDRVKNDVNVAKRHTEIIEKDVKEWLEKAEEELKETQRLVAEIELKKCFDWCPTWGWRYCLSKKVAKKTWYINELLQGGDFQRVGIRPPLQGIEFFPSKDFQSSESSNSAFDGIMKALNTNGVNMIGLYGMPGVGKTTLAKEVGRQAKEQKFFDNVVMVTMSQTPNISNIQCRIAELLGLEFKASTEEGKTEELWRGLKGVEKILIIIDDVWKEFRLQSIGIPFGVEHEGCKILLTTRLQQVCVGMNCQKKFQLDILSEDEAWALFKENAGLKDDTSTLNDVAKEVASECDGLPLAIVTIGKALNGANLNGWKVACQRLKDSRHLDNEDVCEGLYNRLKLSYDYLKGDNIRSCFLLCSLFPEDFDIGMEQLVMFAMGHGLFSNVCLVEALRMEICEALRKLQGSGLLLKTNDDDDDEIYGRMHDVIRDFAHWITQREEKIFMVKEGLMEWPTSESLRSYEAISFWNSDINNFSEKLEFSKLQIFVFSGKKLVRVPGAFVQGMKSLQILYLRNVIFSLEVFKFVSDLRTLYFEDCKLENISSLKNLTNLEFLALLKTNVYELPGELVALRRLKSLHFSPSRDDESNFPPNLLSRLTSLQELHVTCPTNVNLSELNSLSRLTALSLSVSTAQCSQGNFVFPKLQRYSIAVNGRLRYMEGQKFRTLEIRDFSSSLSAFKELFRNVEKLDVWHDEEHKNIVPNVDQEGLNELVSLSLYNCYCMDCLVDTTGENEPTTAFSNLVKLDIRRMSCFKELCHGPPPISFLQKLKDVVIIDCDELKSVFKTCGAQCLFHLQQLTIFRCQQLEEVSDFPQEMVELEEYQVPPLSNLKYLKLKTLLQLKWIWKGPTNLINLQSLKTMRIASCWKLAYLFPTALAQSLVNLEDLQISRCDSLEHIIMEESENEGEIVSNILQHHSPLCWSKLKTLHVFDCESLKYVFPISLAKGLPYLESVVIAHCSQLKQVFNMTKEKGECGQQDTALQHPNPPHLLKLTTLEISHCPRLEYVLQIPLAQGLPQLKSLSITNAPQLKQVFNMTKEKGDCGQQDTALQHLNLPHLLKLTTLKISHCPRLEYVLQIPLAQGLPQLESLSITDTPQLKQVFKVAKERNGVDHAIALPHLQHLRLENLINLSCFCSENYPIVSSSLEKLIVVVCPRLENFSIQQEDNKQLQLKELWLSKLGRDNVCGNQKIFQNQVGHFLSRIEILSLKLIHQFQGSIPVASFQYLRWLRMSKCNGLKSLFSSMLARNLPQLKLLHIKCCEELEEIIEMDQTSIASSSQGHLQPISFPSLEFIGIYGCRNLKSLFSLSIIRSLSELKDIEICGVSKLEQVFYQGHELDVEDDQRETVFPKLRGFKLSKLPNLKSFIPMGCHFLFPSCSNFEVTECPKLMTKFNMDSEHQVHAITEVSQQVQNHTLEGFTSIEEINDNNSVFIWSRENVKEEIDGYVDWRKTSIILHKDMNFLNIKCCGELGPIGKPQSWMFPLSRVIYNLKASTQTLKRVWIYGCYNLKILFYVDDVTCSLTNLESIKIYGASKLEQVFGHFDSPNVEDGQKKIVFPALKELKLSELPSLSSFGPTGCQFQFPSLSYFKGIEFFPSKDFKSFESSNATFNGIIAVLNTNVVNMIGLYGMPGVGKTTLAKEVGKHAKEQKLFDNVVMVTMSQTPNISNIQARIAELLGLKFETSTGEGKAEELWRGLKSVKKILIIIDDVWKNFELQTIGIPFGDQHEGCKILLTTRLQQVCVGMDCQKNFELHVLSEVEAWALFKDNAGLTNATSTLNDVAKEVASECKGLPLAIVTLGKALKGEDLKGWRIANQRLKESRHLDNEDVYEDVYNGLKLSYDYLKGDSLQSCFLWCSFFPEVLRGQFDSRSVKRTI